MAVQNNAGDRRLLVMCRDEPTRGWNLQTVGLSRALLRLGVPSVWWPTRGLRWILGRAAARARLVRPLLRRPRTRLIAPTAWASDSGAFPYAYWTELVPWIYDCWEPQFHRWERLLRRHRVRTAFFTARDAAAHFRRAMPGLETHWVPEAVDLDALHPGKPLADRSIHVLELGRRWALVHDRIREPLRLAGHRHQYSSQAGPAIPGGYGDLNRALGDSAISLCFPKSVTHPEGAGGVETVTQRYFEVLGSGCLAVGTCPGELRDLFGFDPVIPVSREDPAGQVLKILERLDEYQPHVDRCLTRVREVGTFELRARTILEFLGCNALPRPVPRHEEASRTAPVHS